MEFDIDDESNANREDVIKALKETLELRRDALRRALQGDLSLLQEYNQTLSGDLLDNALDSAQYEISSQLVSVQSEELAKTEEALERMRTGTYGICEVTGEPISLARLIALPYTTLSIQAARELENGSRSRRPHSTNWDRMVDLDRSDDSFSIGDMELYTS